MSDEVARSARIVLYVDGSDEWHEAAKLLGDYLRERKGHVTVTSALFFRRAREKALQRAKEILALPEDRVALVGRAGLIEYVLPSIAREAQAQLVIVGRLGSADRMTSGFIAQLVAKRTPASVLIARGRPRAIRRVLVCTEGASHGRRVFDCGAEIARAFDAKLDVLHVVSQMGLTDSARDEVDKELRDFLHSQAPEAEHLRELDARLREIGVQGSILVRSGLVVDEILEAVREGGHDLLLIGAHDLGPRANLYEDFASLILRASPTSTLVLRDGASGPVKLDDP